MRLIGWEMKKILRPSLLFMLAVLFGLYGMLFLVLNTLPYFGNDNIDISLTATLVKKYGPTLEPEERRDADGMLDEMLSKADGFIKKYPIFAEAGIYSYADYEEKWQKSSGSHSDKESKAFSFLAFSEECEQIGYCIQQMRSYLQEYDEAVYLPGQSPTEQGFTYSPGQEPQAAPDHDQMMARAATIIESGEYRSILSWRLIEAFQQYAAYVLIFMVISVCALVAPMPVRDRLARVPALQRSSRVGRGVYWKQLGATIACALLLIFTELLLCGVVLYFAIPPQFWACNINSFLNYRGIYWISATLGQYALLLLAMMLAYTLGAAALAFFLAKCSGNYVSLLLKLIPIMALLVFLTSPMINMAFSISNTLYHSTYCKFIEALLCAGVLVIGFACCTLQGRWEKKRDC